MTTITLHQTPRRPKIAATLIAGLTSCCIFVGGFGYWASIAELDSAAIAAGSVITKGKRKVVQHLEGGIVAQIHAEDGDMVRAGDVLIRLDETQARTRLANLDLQAIEHRATIARLQAELTNAASIAFPADLAAADAAEVIASQQRLFQARRITLTGQTDILDKQLSQLDAEIAAHEAQIIGADKQLAALEEELGANRKLVKKGHAKKSALLALEREHARLTASKSEHRARIAQAEQRRSETALKIIDVRNQRIEAVATTLRETEAALAEVREQQIAARDVLNRIEIVAPTDGVIVNLAARTIGGVIAPGGDILEIVPADEPLVIEAALNPVDIDTVHVGQTAQVKLVAFNQRTTPALSGRVLHVSADAMEDHRTGEATFVVHVAVDRDDLAAVDGGELSPGMPAEVQILTARRTALDYMIAPLRDSFDRAFRES